MSNKCVMKKTAKYTSERRPSPAFEANKCCDEYRWGNDTYLYRSVMNKKGICRWQRVKQLRDAANMWTGQGRNNIISYGCPFNYDRTSIHNFASSTKDHKYGTIIDLNLIPSIELERLDNKSYTLRGEDDINEMKKYASSDDLYEWFTNKLDDLNYTVVDYGVRNTETVLVGASVFHLGDSYKDGIQFNFTLHSKLPLNQNEINFAVEALTSFDDDGNYPLKIKGGRKYKKNPLVFTSVPSDYKVSTWIMTDKPVNNRYYKNLKAYQVGTQNNKKMPTYPILDAKQYYAPGDEEARFMYPKNKAAHDKHKDSKQVKPSKPTKPSSNKSSCTKRNPSPPCKKGFETKTNKKGDTCCYKSKSKPNKSSSGISADRLAYINWIDKVLEGNRIEDESGNTLGYVPNNPNCHEQTSKKYTSSKRKSPPYKANLCCGEVKLGNDGNRWVSKMNKNGVCVWRALN